MEKNQQNQNVWKDKYNQPLVRLTKKKREKTQIVNIRYERLVISTDPLTSK